MTETAKAKREMEFLLAKPERWALQGMAKRTPLWLNSNHFTALGVIGATACGTAYSLSSRSADWLWLASVALVLNWFGDSLDGTLARVRKAERPRYGYYIDHIVDAYATFAIGVGLGLSPFVRIEIALLLVLAYLTMSINVYLESAVFGVFKISYGKVGPTEARLLLIVANGWRNEVVLGANIVVGAAALGMAVLLVVRFAQNLRRLAREEPRKRYRDRAQWANKEPPPGDGG
jgi:phosphatidylglycerophosphate synthase